MSNGVPGKPEAQVPVALCLGGLDPSAGAGLLRDAMTVSALGVLPMAICTADTVQNGESCLAISPPPDPRPALTALGPHLAGSAWGLKLGLCALPVELLADLLALTAAWRPEARIWDPILAPTAGTGLHSPSQLRTLAGTVLGTGSWVVCPNLPEAAALAGTAAMDPAALAQPLLDLGAEAVWLKGGHGPDGEVEDFWITAGGVTSLGRAARLPGDRRGTGCTLASAWLAWRLRGLDGPAAAKAAVRFLRDRWQPGLRPGGFGRPCFAPGAP